MQINSELITEIILYGDNIVSKVFMITRLVTKLTRPIEKLTPEILVDDEVSVLKTFMM
jgi:hypothetical protein